MSHVDGVDDGIGYGTSGFSIRDIGVSGSSNSGVGVRGYSPNSIGVYGFSNNWYGMAGVGPRGGVYGFSDDGYGMHGNSIRGYGVYGISNTFGIFGTSDGGHGVFGKTSTGNGVSGESITGLAVAGVTTSGVAVAGRSNSPLGYAAYLEGDVRIIGSLLKAGGSFKIDHPLDPVNKYLHHSFVESPDMKNVYDGVVVLDDNGEAEIDLPDWFGALNKDFRYQITALGAPGPNLYIATEIPDTTNYSSSNSNINNNSHFKIAGGSPNMKVSWQVTGIRKDPWANAHRIQVEEDKPDKERGYYMYPDLYGQPAEKGISRLLFPEEVEEPLVK